MASSSSDKDKDRFQPIQDYEKETIFESYTQSKFIGFESDNKLEHDVAVGALMNRETNNLKRQRFITGFILNLY